MKFFRIALTALFIFVAVGAHAQVQPWHKSPSVVVLGAADDPRVPLVKEAVQFWNGVFAEIGTPFRLGEVTVVQGLVPGAELKKMSDTVLAPLGRPSMPAAVQAAPGDMVVVLSNADFVSFTARWPDQSKAMFAIKSHRAAPLDQPNVVRNVIAHEMGHAIGLGHNSDPAMLMCGRPASCRPDAFRSNEPHYFPLTPSERATLRRLYPADWHAK